MLQLPHVFVYHSKQSGVFQKSCRASYMLPVLSQARFNNSVAFSTTTKSVILAE